MQQQQDPPPQKELLDLEAIEAALVLIPVFPAYFNDMRLLVAEVRRLRARTEELQGLVDDFQNWCAATSEWEMPPSQLAEEIEGVPV